MAATELRKTGISVVGDIPWGTHFCHFYETEADLVDILIPYLKMGLEHNEFCIWLVATPANVEAARRVLSRAVPESERHLATGDMEIVPRSQWVRSDGTFDLQLVSDNWQENLVRALAGGYAGMRVIGNVAWMGDDDWKNFLRFEKMLNKLIAGRRIILSCTYPLATSRADEVFDVARAHRFAVAKRKGAWEVVETPEFKGAKAEIERLNQELEQRVVERTTELAAANEELRREIIEREGAEESQRENQQQYESLVHTIDGIVWEIDDARSFRFTFVSKQAERLLGYPAERWLNEPNFWTEHLHPDDREWAVDYCRQGAARRESHQLEYRMISAEGQVVWLRDIVAVNVSDDNAVRLSGVMVDITESKHAEEVNRTLLHDLAERVKELTAMQLAANLAANAIENVRLLNLEREKEEQLRQSQKMEAVGKLAGGIAHDFNNLLTAINGYSELTMRQLRPEDPLRRNVEEIKKAGDRAAGLTRQLLAFSRKQVMQPKVFDLNTVVAEMEKMLHRLIGEDIELKTMLDANLGSIKADPGQIEQVLMNLAVNARDAMPRGGKLTIETANISLDEEYAAHHVAVKSGSYVVLSISDNGEGMDAETQKRIFEPFYTTKEQGKGTGLGLSTVYGIVKQSGGSIWVYSESGLGTTFKIYLPRAVSGVPEYKRNAELQVSLRGTETILLAEDDERVRSLVCKVLGDYGYRILEAANGAAALSICEDKAGEPIHLLLTDVVMPEMSGRTLADRFNALRPDGKVLYMSGYTDEAIVHHGVLDADAAFIQKPFTPDSLARKVRETLGLTEFQDQREEAEAAATISSADGISNPARRGALTS